MRHSRTMAPVVPTPTGRCDGLAYTLWLPGEVEAPAGVVILHGAGSSKENHQDFARAAGARGLAALAFDARGHGASEGALDGRAIDDVVTITGVPREALGDGAAPIALRGSSMGGYFALVAADRAQAAGVVAICPASAAGLRRGLHNQECSFRAEKATLSALLDAHDLHFVVPALLVPVLLLHAERDEVVPIARSRELARRLAHPDSRLLAVRGGHHRSIQHDPGLQAESLRFVAQLARGGR